ncbi:TP53-binding protein 1 [Nymphon striatum]|nr:TP53-binding protein 1 [Nymphon striatum]
MRSIKTSGGLTRGRGMTEIQRLVSMPACVDVNCSMQELTQVNCDTSEQHKDTTCCARQKWDTEYTHKILSTLKDLDPFGPEPSLHELVSGLTAHASVNVDNTIDIQKPSSGSGYSADISGSYSSKNSTSRSSERVSLSSSNSSQQSLKDEAIFSRPQNTVQKTPASRTSHGSKHSVKFANVHSEKKKNSDTKPKAQDSQPISVLDELSTEVAAEEKLEKCVEQEKPSVATTSSREITKDSIVMARFKDSNYYPARVKDQNKMGKWIVTFIEDNITLSLWEKDIIAVEKLPIGLSVKARSVDNYEEFGMVRDYYKTNKDEGYVVSRDDDLLARFSIVDVFLTDSQAQLLEEDIYGKRRNESVLSPSAGISLENMIDKKRRAAATSYDSGGSTPRSTRKSMRIEDNSDIERNSRSRSKRIRIDPVRDRPKFSKKKLFDSDDVKSVPSSRKGGKAKPTSLRQKQLFHGMAFLSVHQNFSSENECEDFNFDSSELENKIIAFGGQWLKDFDDIRHSKLKCFLLANDFQTTTDYIKCVASGVLCLNSLYIRDCIARNTLLDKQRFALPTGRSIIDQTPIPWHGKTNALCKLKILVNGVKSFQDMVSAIITSAGGIAAKFLTKIPKDKDFNGVKMVVSSPNPTKEFLRMAMIHNVNVCSDEWLTQSIITGTLFPHDAHENFSSLSLEAILLLAKISNGGSVTMMTKILYLLVLWKCLPNCLGEIQTITFTGHGSNIYQTFLSSSIIPHTKLWFITSQKDAGLLSMFPKNTMKAKGISLDLNEGQIQITPDGVLRSVPPFRFNDLRPHTVNLYRLDNRMYLEIDGIVHDDSLKLKIEDVHHRTSYTLNIGHKTSSGTKFRGSMRLAIDGADIFSKYVTTAKKNTPVTIRSKYGSSNTSVQHHRQRIIQDGQYLYENGEISGYTREIGFMSENSYLIANGIPIQSRISLVVHSSMEQAKIMTWTSECTKIELFSNKKSSEITYFTHDNQPVAKMSELPSLLTGIPVKYESYFNLKRRTLEVVIGNETFKSVFPLASRLLCSSESKMSVTGTLLMGQYTYRSIYGTPFIGCISEFYLDDYAVQLAQADVTNDLELYCPASQRNIDVNQFMHPSGFRSDPQAVLYIPKDGDATIRMDMLLGTVKETFKVLEPHSEHPHLEFHNSNDHNNIVNEFTMADVLRGHIVVHDSFGSEDHTSAFLARGDTVFKVMAYRVGKILPYRMGLSSN